jgi:uncharacterized protein YlaI
MSRRRKNRVTPPGTAWCAAHNTAHPVADFGIADAATGRLRGSCTSARNAQSRGYYAENKETRQAEIHARRRRLSAEHHTHINTFKAQQSCNVCGTSGATTTLTVQGAQAAPLRSAVGNDATTARIDRILNDPATTFICRPCSGRIVGSSRAGQPRNGRPVTVDDAIVTHVPSGDTITNSGLYDALIAAGVDVARTSINVYCTNLVKAGRIRRVKRGTYTAIT